VSLLDNIYVLGGKRYPNGDTSIFGYLLLQPNNQWGEIRIIPEGYSEDSAITVMGNNIIVLGGRMNGILTNTAYSYQAINIVFIPLTK
jgi:hypothetical protein